MYNIGDFVVYGNKGVCEVKKIGPLDIPGMSADRDYYFLSQVNTRASMIFTPVDNAQSSLRPVLSHGEMVDVIHGMKEYKPVWSQNDKEREQYFTSVIREADPIKLSEMIVTLCHRRDLRIADGKKATSTDERFLHAAEDIFFGEVGIALGIEKSSVKEYIKKEIGHK